MAEKKVVFSGVDNVSSMFAKLKASSQDITSQLVRDARQYSDSGREQIDIIDEQIDLIQKRFNLESQTPQQQQRQQQSLNTQVDQQQQFSPTQQRAEQDDDLQQSNDERQSSSTSQTSTDQSVKDDDSRQVLESQLEQQKVQSSLTKELINAVQNAAKREIQSEAANTEREIQSERSGIDNAQRQDDSPTSSSPDSSTPFVSEQDDNLPEQPSQQAQQGKDGDKDTPDIDEQAERGVNQAVQIANNPASALAGIPIVGAALAYAAMQGTNLQNQGNQFQALTGESYRSVGSPNSFGVGVGASFGMTRAQMLGVATELARAQGSADDIVKETTQVSALQKAFSLDQSVLMGTARLQQFDSNERGVSGDVQNFIKVMQSTGQFEDGDFTRLGELLEIGNQIAERQAATLENIDTDTNAEIIAQFQEVGGSFADRRAGERIQTINQALTDPGNDFMQALNYQVLRQQNPEASFFELQEMQEKGLAQEGMMSGTMEAIQQMAGGDQDLMMQLVKSRFGLSAAQTRQLTEAYSEDDTIFDKSESVEDALQQSDINAVGRAASLTGTIPRTSAMLSDVAAGAGDQALGFLEDQVGQIQNKGFEQYAKDTTDKMAEGVQSAFESAATKVKEEISGAIGGAFDGVADKIKENLSFFGDG